MAPPRVEKLITALDIGSFKVGALIVGQSADGQLHWLGSGQRESRGMRDGFVADVNQVDEAVRETLTQAERIAGLAVDKLWGCFSAGGMSSKVGRLEVELGGHRIEQSDVDALLAAGRSTIMQDGRTVLHAQPALYTLDGMTGVLDPINLYADRLGVDIHVVLADTGPVRNLEQAIRAAHVGVEGIVAAPLATGLACLTEEERDLGIAIVEIGAAVTNVALFAGGILVEIGAIPTGAAHITDDIASAFGTRRSQAERLKCFYGSATASPRDHHEMLDIGDDDDLRPGLDRPKITRAQLNAVIRQRVDQMLTDVNRKLREMGFTSPVAKQVVLTGGGAELKGLAEHGQSVMGRAVRIGRPGGILGMADAHSGPAFSALVGTVLYAASGPMDLNSLSGAEKRSDRPAKGMLEQMLRALKANF